MTHDGMLSGLRALVTGGGSGIGAVITTCLRREGSQVLVVDADVSTAPDVVADVSLTAGVDALFDAVRDRLGGLDLLVNNVGVAGPTATVHDMDPGAFDQCVQVNLGSAFRCTRLAVPLLRERKGSIVNISSTAGIFGYPLRSPYVAAKWGVIGLTKTWAMELGPEGIRVNAICPGSVGGPRMDGVIEREAAAQSDPSARMDILRRVAQLHREKLGNAKRAIDVYREILRADPHDAVSMRALVEIYEAP